MKFRLSSEFGELSEVREGAHTGIDIAMESGTTLRTLVDGVVYGLRYNEKIGKGVIIKTEDGNYHVFGHLSKITVEKGDKIQGGDIIGMSGNTGNSTNDHLHFGIQQPDGTFIDPSRYYEPLTAISGDATPLEIANAVNAADHSGFGGWVLDQYNDFSDWVIGKEVEFIAKPIAGLLKDLFITMWEWFVFNLPDLMGYISILAGILIILTAMMGRGGLMKTIGWYAGVLILSFCILGGE